MQIAELVLGHEHGHFHGGHELLLLELAQIHVGYPGVHHLGRDTLVLPAQVVKLHGVAEAGAEIRGLGFGSVILLLFLPIGPGHEFTLGRGAHHLNHAAGDGFGHGREVAGAGLGIGGVDGLIVGAAVRTLAEGPVGGFGVVVVILARGRFDVQGDDPDAFLAGEVAHFLGAHAHAGVAVGLLQGPASVSRMMRRES